MVVINTEREGWMNGMNEKRIQLEMKEWKW